MKIGFVINDYVSERAGFTTTGMALEALRRGHDVYYIPVEDFVYTTGERMAAHARKVPDRRFRGCPTMFAAAKKNPKRPISAVSLDVLMLRNDPSNDTDKRPWAQDTGIVFGRLAKRDNVLVLNDPDALAYATNKMYFQYFPKSIRPETIITRNIDDINAFYRAHNRQIILKPLQGSGGKNVFLVNEGGDKNINQIVEAIGRDGFIVAQEYLPEASKGDIRLFLLEGKPIVVNNKIAAVHRTQAPDDIRSNIHQGGRARIPKITAKIHEIVEEVGPKLLADGMFFVGLDIVGDKVMEVNVFSPGGLNHAGKLQKVDFFTPLIDAIEKKAG